MIAEKKRMFAMVNKITERRRKVQGQFKQFFLLNLFKGFLLFVYKSSYFKQVGVYSSI